MIQQWTISNISFCYSSFQSPDWESIVLQLPITQFLLLFCCCSWGCPQGPLLLPGLSIGSDLMTFTELLYSTSTSVIPPPPSSKEDDDENEHKVPHLYNVNWELFFVNAFLRFFFERNSSSILLLNYILLWVVLIVSNTSWYTDMALNWCVPKKDI